MDKKRHIICLNGLTSSAKTSIAKEIINLSDRNYYVSNDIFEQMANIKFRIESYYTEMKDFVTAMHQTLFTFLKLGKNVILDTVMLDIPEIAPVYVKFLEACKDIDIFYVNVTCSLDECKRRNILRGDRGVDQSHWQSGRMVRIPYDFSIDTTDKTIEMCAKAILSSLDERLT